jgi:putative MFS transporter
MSLLTLMPTFLVAQGITLPTTLGFTLIQQIGSFLGALCAAFVTYRWPRRLVVAGAALLGAADGIAFAFLADTTFLVVLLSSIINFFILLATTTLWSWAPELYPTRVRAFGISTIKSVGGIGIVVCPPLLALVFDRFGLGGVFACLAAMFLAACGFALAGVETKGYELEAINELREDATPDPTPAGTAH